jgi:hypothetical protein
MKTGLNEINMNIEQEIRDREETEIELLNSFKEVHFRVKSQIEDEKLKRDQFETNIFKLLEETTRQLSLIN